MRLIDHSTAPAPAITGVGLIADIGLWAREIVRQFSEATAGVTVGLAVIKAEELLRRPLTMDETTLLVHAIEREWNARPESIKAGATLGVEVL